MSQPYNEKRTVQIIRRPADEFSPAYWEIIERLDEEKSWTLTHGPFSTLSKAQNAQAEIVNEACRLNGSMGDLGTIHYRILPAANGEAKPYEMSEAH